MAKSIRSKEKRRHRAEFRRTIGTEVYNAFMAKTQAKMKEYLARQSTMNSLERLSATLNNPSASSENNDSTGTSKNTTSQTIAITSETRTDPTASSTPISMDMEEGSTTTSTTPLAAAASTVMHRKAKPVNVGNWGENKAIPKRKMSRAQKHMLKDKKKVHNQGGPKQQVKPRFFCQF